MAADIIWPADTLKATGGKSKVAAATIGGGRTLAGLQQVIANDAGFWRLTMAAIIVKNNEHVRIWNQIEVILQGRSGTALVPFLDCHRAPWPTVDGEIVTSYGGIPHSDDSLFSDGSGYYQPVIVAEAEAVIAAGATSGQIRIAFGGELLGGMHFSAGERGYRIKRVLSSAEDTSGHLIYSVTFWPPAREAIPENTALEFDEPKFRARLATDEEMDLDPELMKFGRPTLNWVEDV